MRVLRSGVAVLFACLFLCAELSAQARSTVFGNVADATGAVVPGAKITLTNDGTHQETTASANESGDYNIPSVVPGDYTLTVSAPGFATYIAKNIDLQVDENRNISVKLAPGAESQQITVSDAGSASVDTRSPTITEVVDNARVVELPLNGRNPLDLQTLVAGATVVSQGGGGQAQQNVIAINGNRQNANNYTLDGADNEDPFFNSPSVVPNPDALDQFSMKTSNYSAAEGRNAGAVSNAIIKSGTNNFHGSVFEYLRNDAFDAYPYFKASRKPPYKRHQYGGAIGGPIFRDRMFFFGSYQGTRTVASPNSSTATVLSAAERTGDFRELCDSYTAAGVCNATTGNKTQLKIPGTANNAPFNNLSAYVYAPSVNFLNTFVPLPNAANNAYTYTPSVRQDEDQYIVKIDSHIRSKDVLSGHFVYVDSRNTQNPNNINLPGFLAQINYKNYHVAVNETHTFSSSLINVLTFGFNNIARNQLPILPAQQSWQSLGSGLVRAEGSAPIGWGTQVTGYFVAQSRWPLNQYRTTYQISDTANWTRGNHSFTFGGDLRQEYTDQSQTFQTDGNVTFGSGYTGNNLGDFITGRPTTINQQTYNGGKPSRFSPDIFVNDDWKIAPRLTLTLGARWEPFRPLHDRLGRVVQFRPGQKSTLFANAPTGYVAPGDAGVPTDTYSGKWNVFSPRVGFAWDIFGDARTSLRGGIGIYNGNIRTQALNNNSTNIPYAQNVNISSPTGGLAAPYQDLGYTPFPYTPPSPSQYGTFVFPARLSVNDFDPRFRQSRVLQWNMNLQQQLPWQMLTTIAYVGSNGEHLFTLGEANPAVYAPTGTTDARRVYAPSFSSITRMYADGHSNYHSLQGTINKRIAHGFSILANYTWSKSLDNGSGDANAYFNPFNHAASRGPSDYDLRHVFVTSALWNIPGPKPSSRLLYLAAGGWSLQGIFRAYSGNNFTILSGADNSKSGVALDQANVVKTITYYRGAPKSQFTSATGLGYFDKSAFVTNPAGTFGNAGRNTMTGPGFQKIDFSVQKELINVEKFKVILRGEAFNLFNHTNLNNPGATFSAATFGRITSAGDSRVLQLAGRIEF